MEATHKSHGSTLPGSLCGPPKTTWLGPNLDTGSIPAVYNLTMDPYEKYDMIFNGAAPARAFTNSPGKYAGQDNGWAAALFSLVLAEFDKTIMKYPSIKRFPGGASNDLIPNLQHPGEPGSSTRPQQNAETWRRR